MPLLLSLIRMILKMHSFDQARRSIEKLNWNEKRDHPKLVLMNLNDYATVVVVGVVVV